MSKGDPRSVEHGYAPLPAVSREQTEVSREMTDASGVGEGQRAASASAGDNSASAPGTANEDESSGTFNTSMIEEDIYGAAFVSFLTDLDPEHGVLAGNPLSIVRLCWTVFVLILNVIIQVFILLCIDDFIIAPATYETRKLYDLFHVEVFVDGFFNDDAWTDWERKEDLCQLSFAQPTFITVILFLWIITITKELRTLMMQIRGALHLRIVESSKDAYEIGEEGEHIIVGMTKPLRMALFALVYGPRLFIACFLTWQGCRWLAATTSFADLVLNCVALVFVIELDELFYDALIPFAQKEQVSNTKVKIQQDSDAADVLMGHHLLQDKGSSLSDLKPYGRCVSWAMGSLVFVLVYLYKLQMVLPNYQYDVHDACIEWYGRASDYSTLNMLFGSGAARRHEYGGLSASHRIGRRKKRRFHTSDNEESD